MILTCPSCATRFLVDDAALGEQGRNVRCAKCKHVWFAEPPAPEPEAPETAAERPAEPARAQEPPPGPDAPAPDERAVKPDAGEDTDAPPLRPSAARARRSALPRERPRQRRSGAVAWVLLILIVAGVLGGSYAARNDIVRLWPAAERLYVTLNIPLEPINRVGLELRNLNFKKTVANGVPVVTVSGEVVSISGETRPVPPIRVALHDDQAKEIFHWTTTAETAALAARGSTTFSTSIENPPQEARGLSVTFVTPGGND